MSKALWVLSLIAFFLLGWTSSALYALNDSIDAVNPIIQNNYNVKINPEPVEDLPDVSIPVISNKVYERVSPHDWIKESQIHVYNDRIQIDLKNAVWARFVDTNSMDPVLDYGANAIEIVPKKTSDIHLGDIVSYKSSFVEGSIVHRVVKIGNDEKGWYAIFKGDNLQKEDPEKVRFEQIKRVVVAIIY